MECNSTTIKQKCNCTYESCSRKGNCCECLTYHLDRNELTACCFPDDVERTYDRSFRNFAKLVSNNKI